MDQNLTNQEFPVEKKKSISSWIFGIFSIGAPILIFMGVYYFLYPWVSNNYSIDLFGVSLGTTIFICIVSLISVIHGLIKGIKGLKSQSKKVSIMGIILCVVGLLITIFILRLTVIIMFTSL